MIFGDVKEKCIVSLRIFVLSCRRYRDSCVIAENFCVELSTRKRYVSCRADFFTLTSVSSGLFFCVYISVCVWTLGLSGNLKICFFEIFEKLV